MLLSLAVQTFASSHREAPAIALDPSADLTDFYAFVSPEDSTKVIFILNVNPLEPAGSGPNFHRFDDNVRYKVNCDNEGDGLEDVVISTRFTTSYQYPDEFLYNLGAIDNAANLNHMQTYTAKLSIDGVERNAITAANPGTVAPANVGVLSTPAGAYDPSSTTGGTITSSHVKNANFNLRFFAGPRQESFYVDLERTFDLLNLANVDNSNTLLGYNVHSIAIEVPKTTLTKDNFPPSAARSNDVIACWATTERRTLTNRNTDTDSGAWVQVARLGMPLVNEVAIPVSMKDTFNQSHPSGDGQFLSYVTDPILPIYMEAILGITNPVSYDAGLGIGGREDLVLAFLTGHPALGTLPQGYALGGAIPSSPGKVFGAFEALRLNLTTASGFPNGRLPSDDVTDVALSAMAGLLIDGTTVSDGVGSTGLTFLSTFPFLADPWFGDAHPSGHHE